MLILLNGVQTREPQGVYIDFNELNHMEEEKIMIFFLKMFTLRYPNVKFVVNQKISPSWLLMLKGEGIAFKCYVSEEQRQEYFSETEKYDVNLSEELIFKDKIETSANENKETQDLTEIEKAALEEWQELIKNFKVFHEQVMAEKDMLEKTGLTHEKETTRNKVSAVLTWKHRGEQKWYATTDRELLKIAYFVLDTIEGNITDVKLYKLEKFGDKYCEYRFNGINIAKLL